MQPNIPFDERSVPSPKGAWLRIKSLQDASWFYLANWREHFEANSNLYELHGESK